MEGKWNKKTCFRKFLKKKKKQEKREKHKENEVQKNKGETLQRKRQKNREISQKFFFQEKTKSQ